MVKDEALDDALDDASDIALDQAPFLPQVPLTAQDTHKDRQEDQRIQKSLSKHGLFRDLNGQLSWPRNQILEMSRKSIWRNQFSTCLLYTSDAADES